LAKAVTEQMARLEMGSAQLAVQVERLPRNQWTSAGPSRVELLYRPGAGMTARPLRRIASGGEISRVMLALKAISMDSEGVDSMVFDEIDTGVSGRMAQVVGEKMCLIAKARQVLCITHLPQIAALGDAHFMVEKTSTEDHTETHVTRLDREGRVRELSRLVGGAADSESSLSHAAHMLDDAAQTKKAL